jgi:preprotein translocase subunit SecA
MSETRLAQREGPWTGYPERVDGSEPTLDRYAARVFAPVIRRVAASRRAWPDLPARVATEQAALGHPTPAALREAAAGLSARLIRDGFTPELTARAFAMVRAAAGATLGTPHFDTQLIGGAVILHGMVAEMETGEGKTLTATLPACTSALAGVPVHLVTVNDYLAARDAEWMRPVYQALGLSVGVVVHGMAPEARRAAYACDVTYCSNKELAFDYLRDRIALGREAGRIQLRVERLRGDGGRLGKLVLRGLHFAIVDEADSVLVDEARVPLIISGGSGVAPERAIYHEALELSRQLVEGRDYTLSEQDRQVRFTGAGRDHLDTLAAPLGPLWKAERRREELVTHALVADKLIVRDRHYLVKDGRVQIIDEYTGRLTADRSWERGLHQLVEVKEGCALTDRTAALARISYQRFFRRYLRLAGMTGTAREVADEMWSVYRIPVVAVPTNRRVIRRAMGDRVVPTDAAKYEAVVERIRTIHAAGRPVLVGTRSVAASEHLSELMTGLGLAHQVLNARQDKDEAEIVARAGELGRITVATNMAGRGTDIKLGTGVQELGGLHVIATERHEAGRIDRQLFGRCGRQGDPGSFEAIASLEDELVTTYVPRWISRIAGMMLGLHLPFAERAAGALLRRAQRAAERQHSRMRRDLLEYDRHLESQLAFSGRAE